MSVFNSTKTTNRKTVNHDGTPAISRTPKMELFLLACGSYAEQGSFYESKSDRSQRLKDLTHKVAVSDPEWIGMFVPWLRYGLGMRTASIVVAAEAANAMVKAGIPGSRDIVSTALWRADEPGEMLAYWMANHGRKIPKPVKRGISDACKIRYTEKNFLKFDSNKKALSFKDVLRIVHAQNSGPRQAALYDYITKGGEVRPELRTLLANVEVRRMAKIEPDALTPDMVYRAGLTWEDIPALTNRPWQAKDWEAVLPSMKYLAVVRNLNNFAKAGISKDAIKQVRDVLASEDDLRGSKTGPLNLLEAIKNQTSSTFYSALAEALDLSVVNVPNLAGKTLILIDTSGSMANPFSKRGGTQLWEAASLFGLALARGCEDADVVSFSTSWMQFPKVKGEDLFTSVKRFGGYNYRGGTDAARAIAGTYKDHNRVIILTDEQYNGGYYRGNPLDKLRKDTMVHTYNLAGYHAGGMNEFAKNRFYTAGLSDRAFAMIPLMEEMADGTKWPWE